MPRTKTTTSTKRTLGMLGGTGWSSTIRYYTLLNQLVNQRLGDFHSANLLLKSIDYNEIMTSYDKAQQRIPELLQQELQALIDFKPDALMVCCNSLHRDLDILLSQNLITNSLPIFHAIELTKHHMEKCGYKSALLLATRFTMEDGFFARKLLTSDYIQIVTLPSPSERNIIDQIHKRLMNNQVLPEDSNYFQSLISKYVEHDAVILGCTEFALAITPYHLQNTPRIIDPVTIQVHAAVQYLTNEQHSL